MEYPLNRRRFISAGATLAASTWLAPRLWAHAGRSWSAYPFSLGVASGEPTPEGVVLWTRLAPHPHEVGGGLAPEPIKVSWEVASDEAFQQVVASGDAVAESDWAHSVHVEVEGLRSHRWYWYRFFSRGEASPVGRFRTTPRAGELVDRLNFAFASCQKYEVGHYTAYRHMVREDLDVIAHLGDYIYEKDDSSKAVRPHGLPVALTLDDYRRRYAHYKTDPHLQAAHAMAPWLVTWDDHEFNNDYATFIPEHPDRTTPEAFRARREAAYRAYYEHMPLRKASRPAGPFLQLFRRAEFGALAQFHILDTRQYRTDQLGNGDEIAGDAPALLDPAGTILGPKQREWLFDGVGRSDAAWNVLAQQVLMARIDIQPGEGEMVDVDKWAGYEFERRAVLQRLHDAGVSNPMVLTGDVHENWVNELSLDHGREPGAGSPVAVEWVGTSITSGEDGVDQPDYLDALMAENPAIKYHNSERGYVRCEVTPETWRTDFRTVPFVTRPGAPLQTRASFVVESGRSKVERV